MNYNHLLITSAVLLSSCALTAGEGKDTTARGSAAQGATQDQTPQPGSAAASGAGTAPGSTGTQSGAEPADKASGGATADTTAPDKSAAPTEGPEASGSSGTQSGPNPAGSPDRATEKK
jgi:predicted small secreted protein